MERNENVEQENANLERKVGIENPGEELKKLVTDFCVPGRLYKRAVQRVDIRCEEDATVVAMVAYSTQGALYALSAWGAYELAEKLF